MRDEKEERKKQARSNKQTRQSNTAHVHVYLGVLCCFALFVCLTLLAYFILPSHVLLRLVCLFDLACFFLSSFSSLIKNMYTCMYTHLPTVIVTVLDSTEPPCVLVALQ